MSRVSEITKSQKEIIFWIVYNDGRDEYVLSNHRAYSLYGSMYHWGKCKLGVNRSCKSLIDKGIIGSYRGYPKDEWAYLMYYIKKEYKDMAQEIYNVQLEEILNKNGK